MYDTLWLKYYNFQLTQGQYNHCQNMETQNDVYTGKPVQPYSESTVANLKHTNVMCKFCKLNNI